MFKPDNREKPISGWMFEQDGQRVMPKYPKDSKELPPLKKVRFGGVDRWDDTDQMAFLWDKAAEWGLRSGLFGPPDGATEPTDVGGYGPDDDVF